jgi:mRNA interferase YafQ
MRRALIRSAHFVRAYRRITQRNPRLKARLEETLREMEEDLFAPKLGCHKLSGDLEGLLACSCGYDCRVVLSLETYPPSGEEVILLLNIGTHDEVY